MRRTLFAGLTALDPGESIFTDGGSFVSRNVDIIDGLLQVGAVTHRHDGAPAMEDPDTAPTVTVQNSGGALPSSTTVFVGFTVLDDSGGESAVSPLEQVTTPAGIDTPGAPTTASASYDVGNLRIGTYYYAQTATDGQGGETPAGPAVTVTREQGHASASIGVGGLRANALSVGGVGWRLYRSANGGQWSFLAEGTGDTYTDSGVDCADCGVSPPSEFENTTRQTNKLTVTVPVDLPDGATAIRVYAGPTAGLLSPSLYNQYPLASAGVPIELTSYTFLLGSPPPVSTSTPGADQINADTDIANFHWLAPAIAASALPGSSDANDVRLVDGTPWVYKSGSWQRMGLVVTSSAGVALPEERLRIASGLGTTVRLEQSGGLVTARVDVDADIRGLVGGGGGGGGGGGRDFAESIRRLPDLIAYLPLQDDALTASGVAGPDATIFGSPDFVTDTTMPPALGAKALSFDGAADFLSLPLNVGAPVVTLVMWANLGSQPSSDHILAELGTASTNGWFLIDYTADSFYLASQGTNGAGFNPSVPTIDKSITVGWHFLTFMWDRGHPLGARFVASIDGQIVQDIATATGQGTGNYNDTLRLMARPSAVNPTAGKLAHFAAYARALMPNELRFLSEAHLNSPDA